LPLDIVAVTIICLIKDAVTIICLIKDAVTIICYRYNVHAITTGNSKFIILSQPQTRQTR
jgi:hypothetical protein